MVIALVASITVNVLLLILLVLQKFRNYLVTKAINNLVGRMGNLERTIRQMPRKITIVTKNDKETSNEQSTKSEQGVSPSVPQDSREAQGEEEPALRYHAIRPEG